MSIVEVRAEAVPAFAGRSRQVAAAFLVLGPVAMTVGFALTAVAESLSPGADDLELARLQPALTGWGALLNLLTVPLLLGWAAVLVVATRRWAQRSAWTGAVATVLQLTALAAVLGMELLGAVLVRGGVEATAIDAAMDGGLFETVPGVVLGVMFFLGVPVAFIAWGIALWSVPWIPRWTAVVMWAIPFLDLGLPERPVVLHVAVFVLLTVASTALARVILRNGAPQPAPAGHTP